MLFPLDWLLKFCLKVNKRYSTDLSSSFLFGECLETVPFPFPLKLVHEFSYETLSGSWLHLQANQVT